MKKKTNFALQRNRNFKRIIFMLVIECIFCFLSLSSLSNGYIVCIALLGIVAVNHFWLQWENNRFFDKNAILDRIQVQKAKLAKKKETLEATLNAIRTPDGQLIFTDDSAKIWETIATRFRTSDQIINSLQKKLNTISDALRTLKKKEYFFSETSRGNLWLYAKSKSATYNRSSV